MVIKQLVFKKGPHYFFNSLVLLKDFDKTKLKIPQHDYVDRSIYHFDYAKTMNNVNPLYLIIPELYGSIEEQKGYKYLIIEPLIDINNEVLTDYKKIRDEILKNINKINNLAHVFKDYHKIRAGSVKCEDEKDEINLPLNKLIKFNLVTISNRLIIEKDNELFLEASLDQCLYDDEWFKK